MDVDTPSGGSKRARRTTELSDDDIPLSARRKASRLSYNESDDEDETDNGDVSRGSGALLDGVEAEQDPDTIRCICGDNDPDEERAFISCDGCEVWQHMSCVGLSGYENEAPDKYLCEQCGPYGEIGAGFGGSQQSALPIRSKQQRGTRSKGAPSGKKTLSELTKSYSNGVLSVKKSKKRVSFSSDVKPASSSSGDQDGYNPSDEAISDDDEADYAGDLSEEDSEDIFLPQSHASRRSEDDDEDIFISQSHPSNPSANATKKPTAAKSPNPPGTSAITEEIVKKWMEGGYAAEFAATEADSDAGSDVSEIEIPDMSEGLDLFAKLVEQEQLIFTLKARLERRGERIKTLKGRVRELEGLRGEGNMLMRRVKELEEERGV
jgi:hypothetical protein